MPIVRTYCCDVCFHQMDVTLSMDQVDDPPPDCPVCHGEPLPMRQEFKPVALGGSVSGRAHAIAEQVMADDYHVADVKREHRMEGTPTVRYKDQTAGAIRSEWTASQEAIRGAIAAGRQTRMRHGSGLDVLQANLKSGVEPDLIENSKRKMIKLY